MAYKLGATEYKRQFYVRQRARGLCLECNNKPEKGHSRCRTCLDRRRNLNTQHKKNALNEGRCTNCLKSKSLSESQQCSICYLKATAHRHLGSARHWTLLQAILEKQGHKCALSGVSLTLGSNAELDHIIPLARGGSKDITNVQWTHVAVNRMKQHLLESEFFSLIESLYHQMRATYEA